MIVTDADIQQGYYGKWLTDKKKNQQVFAKLGKEVTVDSISRNIETGNVKLNLSFEAVKEPVCSRETGRKIV